MYLCWPSHEQHDSLRMLNDWKQVKPATMLELTSYLPQLPLQIYLRKKTLKRILQEIKCLTNLFLKYENES